MSDKVVWPDSSVTVVADVLKRNAAIDPNALAVSSETGVNYTHADLEARTNRFGHAMQSIGVKKGNRVCAVSMNRPEWYDIYFGNGKIGAVTVPLNFRLAPPEMQYIINQSDATTLICSGAYVDSINSIRANLPKVVNYIVFDGHPDGYINYADWTAAQPETPVVPDAPIVPGDVFWQMYTSGTTGRPKGAVVANEAVITNISQIAGCMSDVSRMRFGNRTLICAPLYHVAAALMSMISIFHGGTACVREAFNPLGVLKDINEGQLTHSLLVPAMIMALISHPNKAHTNFSSLKLVLYGASAIAGETLKAAMATFSESEFLQAFGQTESTAVMSMLTPEMHKLAITTKPQLIASCGRPVAGADVHVFNANDEDVKPGEVGEVCCRGKNVMLCYYNMPEQSAEALRGGYLRTGDLGTVDEEGYIYIKDRAKDMVVTGGENVYPKEVEDVLFEMPQIADVAVIGVPDSKYGEAVKAIVVLKPEQTLTIEELVAFCRARIAGYKIPRSVSFIAALPRNPSGKVLKTDLRAPYWQGMTRNVN